jgi:hypothetical protein
MSKKYYVPRTDNQFLKWIKFLIQYVIAHAARFGILPPDGAFAAMIADFESNMQACEDPNHGKLDTTRKNETRKTLEKAARELVQSYLARNPKVTKEDREAMGITVYDTVPTAVGEPVGDVTATVERKSEGVIMLHITHVDTTPYDARANYGVKVRYGVFPIETVTVDDVNRMTETVFTRRKTLTVKFGKEDFRKMAFFCMRYENSKGQAGQWGPVVSAVIS